MKRIVLFVIAAALVFPGLSGCVIINPTGSSLVSASVRGSGDVESFEFKVAQFSKVRVMGRADIHYYAADSDIVKLEIHPNLREYFEVDVTGGELVVRTRRGVNMNSGIRPVLTISTPVLDQLIITGEGAFTAHDKISTDTFSIVFSGSGSGIAELDVQSLNVNISGSGSFSFSGLADIANYVISGAGNLDALALQSRQTTIRISGSGRLGVNSSETLNINASGSGNVSYKGSPRLTINNSGPVRLINLD